MIQPRQSFKISWEGKLQALLRDTLLFPFPPKPLTLEERRKEWIYYSNLAKNKTKTRRLPDVIGIGVKKCGTDAVISFLSHHPFIKTPIDVESFFFNHKYGRGLKYYRTLMPKVADHELVMEKTPSYFDCPPITLPSRIHSDVPRAKLILVVCDPVKRSYSDYAHERARYKISKENRVVAKYDNFDSYLDDYLDKVNRSTSLNAKATLYNHFSNYYEDHAATLLTTGFYSVYLPRWTKLFNSSNLLILNGDQLLKNPGPQMELMQHFLKIPILLRAQDYVKSPVNGLFCVRPWWYDYDFNAEMNGLPGWEKNLICLSKTKGRTRFKNGSINATTKHLNGLKSLFKPFNEELLHMTGIKLE